MNPTRLVVLGVLLIVFAIVLLIGMKTDAERDNPDRQMTPLRDQWPVSLVFGRDWNLRSLTALMSIVLGFLLQVVAVNIAE